VADTSTTTSAPPGAGPDGAAPAAPAPRTITRRRTLPGGRAVLGALLVALAVIGVVAAHLSATATPRDRYLVAVDDLPAGTLLGDTAAVQLGFRQVALDLPPEVAARAVHVDDAASLVGRRLLAAVSPGDLLLSTNLAVAGEDAGTSTFTFAIAADAAVGGALTVGDRIDVLATVGTGADATTAYVVRAAPLSAISATGGGLGGDGYRLTVELARPTDVQALAHALATAEVVVVRSPDGTNDAPPPYRFDPDAPGVAPADAPEGGPTGAAAPAAPGAGGSQPETSPAPTEAPTPDGPDGGADDTADQADATAEDDDPQDPDAEEGP
jgi:hypothetical protein